VTRNTRPKSEGRRALDSPRETPHQDLEEINLIATHPREIVPQDCRNWRRQGGCQVRHRWREECIQVNHDLRYATRFMLTTFYLIIASEGRSQARMKQRRYKSCCVSVRLQRPKRWLSRRINLHQSQWWCRSGAPKIAMPTKSIDPKKREV
jgi:hypothetical protein